MSEIFVPERLPTISINDRVELTVSMKSEGIFLTPGIMGKVISDLKPLFGVKFDGEAATLKINARFLRRLSNSK